MDPYKARITDCSHNAAHRLAPHVVLTHMYVHGQREASVDHPRGHPAGRIVAGRSPPPRLACRTLPLPVLPERLSSCVPWWMIKGQMWGYGCRDTDVGREQKTYIPTQLSLYPRKDADIDAPSVMSVLHRLAPPQTSSIMWTCEQLSLQNVAIRGDSLRTELKCCQAQHSSSINEAWNVLSAKIGRAHV